MVNSEAEDAQFRSTGGFGVPWISRGTGVLGDQGMVEAIDGVGEQTEPSEIERAAIPLASFQPWSNPGVTGPTGQEGARVGIKEICGIPFRFPSTLGDVSSM